MSESEAESVSVGSLASAASSWLPEGLSEFSWSSDGGLSSGDPSTTTEGGLSGEPSCPEGGLAGGTSG